MHDCIVMYNELSYNYVYYIKVYVLYTLYMV